MPPTNKQASQTSMRANTAENSEQELMDIGVILEQLSPQLDKLEQIIIEGIQTDIPLLTHVAEHILASGGKRLRPALVFLGAAMFDCADSSIMEAAQIVEYLHTATLLHDDVVDGADTRRSQKAARKIWGNDASVLTGDYLFSKAFHMLTELRHPGILQLMADTTTRMAKGELLQLLRTYNTVNEKEYLEIILNKTASLFASAIKTGAVLAGGKEPACQNLHDYGMALGMAFQIVDDALDYSDEEQTGKPVGTDLQERKMTLPISHLLCNANTKDKQRVSDILEQTEITQEHIQEVIEMMNRYGSIHHTLKVAKSYIITAQSHLVNLPNTPTRQVLNNIADFVVYRHT